jgi:hypothetical protein
MHVSADKTVLARDYEAALRTGDLQGQYEILRHVQQHPDLLPIIEDVEGSVMASAPVPEVDWADIRAGFRTSTRAARVLLAWERGLRRLEPLVRITASVWPPMAALILAAITYAAMSGAGSRGSMRGLVLLGFVVLGTVVVLCASNLWNPVSGPRRSGAAAPAARRRPLALLMTAGMGLATGAAAAALLLTVWLRQGDVMHTATLLTRSGTFSATGIAELPPLPIERADDSRYMLVVSRGGAKGPLTVTVYDREGKSVTRQTAENGKALVELSPDAARVRLEVPGALDPTAVRWETKVVQLDPAMALRGTSAPVAGDDAKPAASPRQ